MKNKNCNILYQALRSLICRDRTPMREQMFFHLRQVNPLLKIANTLYLNLGPYFRFFAIWIYAVFNLMRLPKVRSKQESLAIAFYKNEQVAIEKFDDQIKVLKPKHSFKFFFFSFKLIRLSYLFAERKSLLFGLRGFSLILNYCYLHKNTFNVREFFGSSEGCPIVYAYLAHAKKKSIPTTFIAHGLCQKEIDKIIYDEIYLMNEREKNRYEKKFPNNHIKLLTKQNVSLKKQELEKKIGIIGSNMMNWKYLSTLCEKLKKQFPEHQIILRRHPNEIIKKKQSLNLTESSSSLMECEFIIGGNSSYLEELRQNGKKVFYESKLDFAPYDAYGLIEDKLIPEFSNI